MPEIKVFEAALKELSHTLRKGDVPYMIIGGLANAIWGNPRATLDIDVTIWVAEEQIQSTIRSLGEQYVFMVEKPYEFVAETRVLPAINSDNFRIDIIFGALPFEEDAIERAVDVKIGETPVMFCTAEDLILLKIISDRKQDLEDVRSILGFQKQDLDFIYLEPRIEELSDLLGRPDILKKWKSWKTDIGLEPNKQK